MHQTIGGGACYRGKSNHTCQTLQMADATPSDWTPEAEYRHRADGTVDLTLIEWRIFWTVVGSGLTVLCLLLDRNRSDWWINGILGLALGFATLDMATQRLGVSPAGVLIRRYARISLIPWSDIDQAVSVPANWRRTGWCVGIRLSNGRVKRNQAVWGWRVDSRAIQAACNYINRLAVEQAT